MNNKFFYHVVTDKPMFVGQIINYKGSNKSGVYKRVIEKEEQVNKIFSNAEKYDISKLDHHTKVAIREFALEKVRKEKFPNYPSRLSSLYVSTDLKDSEMWAKVFIKKGRNVLQIVKLKTDGRIFTGDAYNCFDASLDEEYNIKKAHLYWENAKNESGNDPIYETIIDGNIEIIEIIKEYNK